MKKKLVNKKSGIKEGKPFLSPAKTSKEKVKKDVKTSSVPVSQEPVKQVKVSKSFNNNYITIDKKRYAVGLFWQPYSDEKNKLREVRSISKIIQGGVMDMYCMKEIGFPQYALASSEKKYKEGMVAAAPFVSSQYSDKSSLLCVFKVPEGWWMLIIRNDIILPEEDILYTSEEEAKKAYKIMLSVPDWEVKIAPSSWGIAKSEEGNLASMIDDYSAAKLKTLNEKNTYGFLIFIIIAVVAAIVGLNVKNSYMAKKAKLAKEALKRQTDKLAKQKQDEFEKKEKAMKLKLESSKPWKNNVDAMDVYNKCVKILKVSYQSFGGWEFVGIKCSKSGAQLGWKKTGFSKDEWIFRAQEDGYIPKQIAISLSGSNNATGSIEFPNLEIINSEPYEDATLIETELKSFFQENKIKASAKLGSKSVSFGEGESAVNREYKYVSFDISSKETFKTFSSFLESFGGFVLKSVEWDKNSKVWKYRGEIYGKFE